MGTRMVLLVAGLGLTALGSFMVGRYVGKWRTLQKVYVILAKEILDSNLWWRVQTRIDREIGRWYRAWGGR